jgi:RNA polymerase sigma-70 factor, ECF subfamily
MMRNILVTHAVHRKRQKRGGDALVVSLDSARASASEPALDIVALDEALKRLAEFDERKSQIVELRFFGGLSEEETAEVLETSLRTIQREWSLARAWLYRELN